MGQAQADLDSARFTYMTTMADLDEQENGGDPNGSPDPNAIAAARAAAEAALSQSVS